LVAWFAVATEVIVLCGTFSVRNTTFRRGGNAAVDAREAQCAVAVDPSRARRMIVTILIGTSTHADCNTSVVSIENISIVAAASFGTWLCAAVTRVLIAAGRRASCGARVVVTV
jgi:hypothetical protein